MNELGGSKWNWRGWKKLIKLIEQTREMVMPEHPHISNRQQCGLIGLHRATYDYQSAKESAFIGKR